jgi:F-type H+-transporting ATPase subunit a
MATDTLTHLTEAAIPAGAEAAKPNVFSEVFGFLGNHHSVSLMPLGKLSLPYMFFDNGSFHYFASEEALDHSGQYLADMRAEASPIGEKGKAVRNDGKFTPVGFDFSITSNLFFLLLGTLLTFLIVRTAAAKAKKSLVPTGIRNLVEVLIVFVRDDIIAPNVAEPYGTALLPYFLTIFFFLMLTNLCGLLPWGHTATSSLEITAALSVCTFFVTQFVGIKSQGIKTFLLHLTGGLHEMELSIFMKIFLLLIMVPIEIMGLFTKPFALAIRLFANMTAGHIIIFSLVGLTFLFHSLLVGAFVTVPFALFVYFLEIFVAVLQAYIFTTLSAVFIGMMAHSAHDEHVHDNDLPHAQDGDHLVATSHA